MGTKSTGKHDAAPAVLGFSFVIFVPFVFEASAFRAGIRRSGRRPFRHGFTQPSRRLRSLTFRLARRCHRPPMALRRRAGRSDVDVASMSRTS